MKSEKGGMSRRVFLKSGTVAAATGLAVTAGIPGSARAARAGGFATLIDLSLCDGCKGEVIPRCVEACRKKNSSRFPEPRKPIKDLWPQKTHDDWSDKRDVIDTLTPYNWITVQRIEVDGKEIFIPRRCMHCDNPPCANLCPFGALNKFQDGSVVINPGICLGGAKCKAVCPWQIPQRQSGVGLYLKLQPMPAGGGVMYKCDMCHDIISKGQLPACVEACRSRNPRRAPLAFGPREQILEMAHKRAREIQGTIYGEKENGGTATIYVSSRAFEKINQAILASKKGPHMGPVEARLKEVNRWSKGFLWGPLAAGLGAVALMIHQRVKGKRED
ncbi:MAG: 4Fe-4S dicluster domain-containing protein [bacterium]